MKLQEDCFRKPNLLLAENMLFYLNTSTNRYKKTSEPWPIGPHTFLHQIDNSGIKMRPLLKKLTFFLKVQNLKS